MCGFDFELPREPMSSHDGWFFTIEDQKKKKIVRDVIYASATLMPAEAYKPVHDVTDTDCQIQNGSPYSCIFATFKL